MRSACTASPAASLAGSVPDANLGSVDRLGIVPLRYTSLEVSKHKFPDRTCQEPKRQSCNTWSNEVEGREAQHAKIESELKNEGYECRIDGGENQTDRSYTKSSYDCYEYDWVIFHGGKECRKLNSSELTRARLVPLHARCLRLASDTLIESAYHSFLIGARTPSCRWIVLIVVDILPEVHYAAHWRMFVRPHLHQIETSLECACNRIRDSHDTKRGSIRGDHLDLGRMDSMIPPQRQTGILGSPFTISWNP